MSMRSCVFTVAVMISALAGSDASACGRVTYYQPCYVPCYTPCYIPCEPCCPQPSKCDCIINKTHQNLYVVIVVDGWSYGTWLQPDCKLTFPVSHSTKHWAYVAYDHAGKLVHHAEHITVLPQSCCHSHACILIGAKMAAERQSAP